MPTDEARVVDRARRSPPLTLPTSVTTPVVSASARFTWSATPSTGTATNVIAADGVEADRVEHARSSGDARRGR